MLLNNRSVINGDIDTISNLTHTMIYHITGALKCTEIFKNSVTIERCLFLLAFKQEIKIWSLRVGLRGELFYYAPLF